MVFVRMQATAPTADGAAPQVAAAPTPTAEPGPTLEAWHRNLAVGLIVGGILAGWGLAVWLKPGYQPPEGISSFAVFYIVAQALERLSELLRQFLPEISAPSREDKRKTNANASAERKSAERKTKGKAIADRDWAMALAIESSDKQHLDTAVAEQQTVNAVRANTTAIYLGINSCLASILCGGLGLFFLRAVGITSTPYLLDVAVSGLAIGGGTKPLHDLITNIQKSKDQKEDPTEVSAG